MSGWSVNATCCDPWWSTRRAPRSWRTWAPLSWDWRLFKLPCTIEKQCCSIVHDRLVVVFQAQMGDQGLALDVAQRVLELHQLDEEIVFRIKAGSRHG